MRWTTSATLATALFFGCGLTGCGEPSPEAKRVQLKVGEAWDAMKAWGADKKNDLVAAANRKLEELGPALEKAKGKGAEAAAGLEADLASAKQKLAEMKDATGDRWAKARDDFMAAYERLKQKMRD